MTQVKKFWCFVNHGVREVFSQDGINGVVDSTSKLIALAKTLQENGERIELLKPIVNNMLPVLDALDSPLGKIVEKGVPLLPVLTGLFRWFITNSEEKITFTNSVELLYLLAYLESLNSVLIKDSIIIEETNISKLLGKQIDTLENDEQDAEKALRCFCGSKIANSFNGVLTDQLKLSGLDHSKVDSLVQQVAGSTYRFTNKVLREIDKNDVRAFLDPYRSKFIYLNNNYSSIDDYMEINIKKLPKENIHRLGTQRIELQEIYVPLTVSFFDNQRQCFVEQEHSPKQSLDQWAKHILLDPEKQGNVMFIQGGAGQGKSSFCSMFAYWVWENYYPIWIPILIRLKDFTELNGSEQLEIRLSKAIDRQFAIQDDWLYDKNTRYLFILDGFDELLLTGREQSKLVAFLEEVGKFQKGCFENQDEKGHRVLITGRPLAIQGLNVERNLPINLERVEIEPMDTILQKEWLTKWENKVGQHSADTFRKWLRDFSQEVQNLVREPLLLYLLAAMSHGNQLNQLEEKTGTVSLQVRIYDNSLRWVLKQREKFFCDEFKCDADSALDRAALIAEEAALCIEQSGGEQANVKFLTDRLKSDRLNHFIMRGKFNIFLVAVHLQPAQTDGLVEFTHKSIREFLVARRLKRSIEDWITDLVANQGRYRNVDERLDGEIYDLLGYGSLKQVIVEYLMALLSSSKVFKKPENIISLAKYLKGFYLKWCAGDFLQPPGIYPNKKHSELKDNGIHLGIKEIDIYVGLNVMILLFELYRYTRDQLNDIKNEVAFYPCKDDKEQLLRIIGYSNCISNGTFADIVGPFLSCAKLIDANLSGANLGGVNLSEAHLSRCNLKGAFLRGADLRKARLKDADLSRACLDSTNFQDALLLDVNLNNAHLCCSNLTNVNLCGADLRDAVLSDADFSSAYLGGTILNDVNASHAVFNEAMLCGADFNGANLNGAYLYKADVRGVNFANIRYDWGTNYQYAEMIDKARNLPIDWRKKQL